MIPVRACATAVAVLFFIVPAAASQKIPSGEVTAQNSTLETDPLSRPAQLNVDKAPLAAALDELYRTSGVPIAYSPTLLSGVGKVTCSCLEISVRSALQRILAGTRFEFVVVENSLVIRPRPAALDLRLADVEITPLANLELASSFDLPAPQQSIGSITGRVLESGTGQSLSAAQVYIASLDLGVLSQTNGRFLLLNVPAGTHTVTAERIGYRVSTETVTIGAGETVTVDFLLGEQALALDEIVVTGAGQATERRRLGNTIATVDAGQIQARTVTNPLDAVRGRVPGLTMYGGSGEGSNSGAIRLRGFSSLALGNDPVIYLDGVRLDNEAPAPAGTGGGRTISRLAEINPNDIERIEILRGAAAATLYGSEANAGVIQIFTKRGTTDSGPNFTVRTSQQLFRLPHRWSANYAYDPASGEIISSDPLADWSGTGHRQDYNVSVGGGTPTLAYFVSGRFGRERGVWERDLLEEAGLTGTFSIYPTSQTLIEAQVGFTRTQWDHPAIYVDGPDIGFVGVITDPRAKSDARPWGEFGTYSWAEAMQYGQFDRGIHRITMSTKVEHTFSPTLSARAQFGFERMDDQRVLFWDHFAERAQRTRGWRDFRDAAAQVSTLDAGTTLNLGSGNLTSSTVAGIQAFFEDRVAVSTGVREFPPGGVEVLGAGSTISSLNEVRSEVVTAGAYVQEQVGIGDRLFLTVGARLDGSSTFGEGLGLQFYPKVAAAYQPDFEWMPEVVSTQRWRLAIGQSGNQPDAFADQRTFRPVVVLGDQPGVLPGQPGNPDLGPERMTEVEAGADLGFFDDRATLSVTYFHQVTKDALIPRMYAPSSGFIQAQLENLGEIKSTGFEIALDASLIESSSLGWNVAASLATLNQKVDNLGGVPPIAYVALRHTQYAWPGYQPFAIFGTKLNEANPYTLTVPVDQLTSIAQIRTNKIQNSAGTDSIMHLQNVLPTFSGTVSTDVNMGRWALNVVFEGAAGFGMWNENGMLQNNPTRGLGLEQAQIEQGLANPSTTSEERAALASRYAQMDWTVNSNYALDADYIRLDQIGLGYTLPAVNIGGTTIDDGSVSVRAVLSNVALWTRWPGWGDPLSSRFTFSSNFDVASDRAIMPRRRSLTLELRASF